MRKRLLLTLAFLLASAGGALAVRGLFASPLPEPPSFTEARSAFHPSERWVVDRSGEVVDRMRIDSHGRRFSWVPLSETPEILKHLVIRSEDRRFESHHGVDAKALIASLWQNSMTRKKSRGASTISMQVAALLSGEKELTSGHRSVLAKIRQMRLAWRLESRWSKAEILEAYLNLVSFRGEIQGLEALSHLVFKKNPHGLTEAESALAAALIRAPNAKWVRVGDRACALSPSVCDEARAIAAATTDSDLVDRTVTALAPHFSRRLLDRPISAPESAPISALQNEKIESTLNADLQREAIRLATEQLALLRRRNVHDMAVLAVDNQSGEVLAYLANVPEFSSARAIDGVQARRQAGSTLKPFLYAAAFERHILTPGTLLSDLPLEIDTGRGLYRPQNYDHTYRGNVTARNALASSMNVPAVRTLGLLDGEDFVALLSRLGFAHLNSAADYGLSLALGTADVSLWQLVRAYRVFANGGFGSELRESKEQTATPSTRIFSAETSFQIGDILSDREARATTFGLENPLSTRFWTAVKTGTSKDMRDNWCIGFSSRYTVGVWVGNFSGEAMWDVSGVSGAAPVWVGVMNYLHAHEPSVHPSPPKGLLAAEPPRPLSQAAFQKILSPAGGAITVWDPDIPRKKQKIRFESTAASPIMTWQLDGKTLGRADRPYLWSPSPGRHHLVLIGDRGHREDEVEFTVRR